MTRNSLDRRSFVGAAIFAGIASTVSSRSAVGATNDVTIAYGSDGYAWNVPYIADGIKAWSQFGLNPSFAAFPTGRASLEATLTKDADFGTATDSPYLFAALRGLKPIIFANYQRYSKEMKVIARTGRGIKQNDPTSLKGKTIATRVGTAGHYMVHRYLEMAKLKKTDITVVNMKPGDAITATVRGDVDAMAWTSRAAFRVQEAVKDKAFVMTQDGFENFFQSHSLLCTNESVVAKRPHLLKPGVQAMLSAEAHIKNDPGWLDIIAERTKTTPERVRKETLDYEFKLTFDEKFVEDLIGAAEWAFEEKFAKRPEKNLRQLFVETFYTKALAELKPERVSIKI